MFVDAPYASRPYADVANIFGLADGDAVATATLDFVIYAATREFATEPTDSVLPSRPFRGTLSLPLNYRRSILGSDIGTFTTGDGNSTLDNSDGAYDFLPQTYSADGRPIEIKVFRKGDDYGRAFTVFKGVMGSWFVDEATVAIDLRDFSYKLAVPAQSSLYGGTGGIDGGADLAQKPKPLALGYVLNVAPPLVSASALLYQVNDGAVRAISAVYVRGSALTPGADYLTVVALLSATIPSGQFATCLAAGFFRINFLLDGQVTADVEGDATGGVFASTSADVVRRLLVRSAVLGPDDQFTASFDDLNASQPAPIGYWQGTDSSATIADVAAQIMRGVGGWAGFRRNGEFEVRRFLDPGAPVAFFANREIIDIKRLPPPSALTPPSYRQRVPYARNWTVQESDVAGIVSSDRKAFLAEADRLAEASAAAIKVDHPFAQDAPPVVAFFRNKSDALAEAQRLLNLYRFERALYQMTLPRKALYLNLGDTISLTYPRFDLALGRTMRVVEITENLSQSDGKIDAVMVTAYG